MVIIGLVCDAGGAGEAVVGVGHLADAEEGGAGREIVRRGVGIGRGAGDAVKVVAQKRGLVNGVVPVLQPVAVRAIHPGGTALLHIKPLCHFVGICVNYVLCFLSGLTWGDSHPVHG